MLIMKWSFFTYLWCLMLLAPAAIALDACPTFRIEITKSIFDPDVLVVPVNTRVKLIIVNNDGTPEEFKSAPLKLKKIILGKSQAVVFMGPLSSGDYPFSGAFHPRIASGIVRASLQPEAKK